MAVNTTQTQTILPDWYTQYARDILSKATAATAQPYTPYGAARIAGFQPEQEEAFRGFQSSMGAYQPYLQSAARNLQQGTQSFTTPGVAQQYMNPYTQNVVSGIGSAAGRNLYENILPQVNRTFVGGGTFGGSRSAEFTARAVRDANAAALSEQNKAMKEGYESGMGQFNTEASRLVTASPYMASLGTQAQTQRNLDLAGLEQIGTQRQQLGQRSADLAYQDFLNQQQYPYEQVQRLAAIGGQPSAQGSGATSTTTPRPSSTGQILGAITGGIGLLGATGAFGRSGWLGLKDGGDVNMKKAKKAKTGLGWLKD
jgi:hypothetical protein